MRQYEWKEYLHIFYIRRNSQNKRRIYSKAPSFLKHIETVTQLVIKNIILVIIYKIHITRTNLAPKINQKKYYLDSRNVPGTNYSDRLSGKFSTKPSNIYQKKIHLFTNTKITNNTSNVKMQNRNRMFHGRP